MKCFASCINHCVNIRAMAFLYSWHFFQTFTMMGLNFDCHLKCKLTKFCLDTVRSISFQSFQSIECKGQTLSSASQPLCSEYQLYDLSFIFARTFSAFLVLFEDGWLNIWASFNRWILLYSSGAWSQYVSNRNDRVFWQCAPEFLL